MSRGQFKRIDVAAAREVMSRPGVVVLDTRDRQSFAADHIAGARNISERELGEIIGGVARDAPVLIYCYRGNASQVFAQTLADFRFSDVYSLDGGFEAWARERTAQAIGVPKSAVLREWLQAHGYAADKVEGADGQGLTPLMRAALVGAETIAAELLDCGAAIEARNADGNTAMWLACVGDHAGMVTLLVKAGANIDNVNDTGATPLMYAASGGKAAALACLLEHGASIEMETPDGFSALDMAASEVCLDLLRAAKKARATRIV